MAILYNLDPMTALEIFYEGEHHGVYKGDFIKNEKKHNLFLPPLLREFLEKYGYLSVNQGGIGAYKIFHPDYMAQFSLSDGNGGEIKLLVCGELVVPKKDAQTDEDVEMFYIGIRPDTPDLQTAMGQNSEEGMDWWPTGRTLEGLLRLMLISIVNKSCDSYLFEDKNDILSVLKRHNSDILQMNYRGEWASVHFNDETGEFLITEFDESNGEMIRLIAVQLGKVGGSEEDLAAFTVDELEELFASEFYMNALNCDFERSLKIQNEIISRLEEAGTVETEMLIHYQLAGRCLAELKRIDEADKQFSKVLEIAERHASEDPEGLANAYCAVGNFYFDAGRIEESDKLVDKELTLRRETTPDDCYHIGMVFCDRAKRLEGDDAQLDRLIELCELALAEFQKDPRDSGCKYEIARMQQLRGNARRRKKELAKNQ